MKKIVLIILSVSPLFGRTDDMQELDFLEKKVNHAKSFAKLHQDPKPIKKELNAKWISLAGAARSAGLRDFITKDLFNNNIKHFPNIIRSTGGQREKILETYEKERDELQKAFDLHNLPTNQLLHAFAQNNLEKAKDAYDKALQNYFEFEDES